MALHLRSYLAIPSPFFTCQHRTLLSQTFILEETIHRPSWFIWTGMHCFPVPIFLLCTNVGFCTSFCFKDGISFECIHYLFRFLHQNVHTNDAQRNFLPN